MCIRKVSVFLAEGGENVMEYQITTKTCALIGIGEEETMAVEKDSKTFIPQKATDILKSNCEYYGSSLEGRLKGSQHQLGMKYKLPFIIENSQEIIFFPTISPKVVGCYWIALNNIKEYRKNGFYSIITFNSGLELNIPVSYESLENQIFRATKLLLITRKRQNKLK